MYDDIDEHVSIGVKNTIRGFTWEVVVTGNNPAEVAKRLEEAVLKMLDKI